MIYDKYKCNQSKLNEFEAILLAFPPNFTIYFWGLERYVTQLAIRSALSYDGLKKPIFGCGLDS